MMTRQITKTTVKTIKEITRTKTYAETAKYLAARGFKTPRGRKPTASFVNYVLSTYDR